MCYIQKQTVSKNSQAKVTPLGHNWLTTGWTSVESCDVAATVK